MGRKTLGELIANYRAANKVSLQTFANKSGLSKAYLCYLEKGQNPKSGKQITPSMDTMRACCEVMGIGILDLLSEMDTGVSSSVSKMKKEAAAGRASAKKEPPAGKNIPSEVPDGIPLTNETLSAAIKERRLLIMPTRVPKKGDIVYVPMAAYMMAVTATVMKAGGGMFLAEGEACGTITFTIFDLEKDVFTTRAGATAAVREMTPLPDADTDILS